jgi:hypothetical protein
MAYVIPVSKDDYRPSSIPCFCDMVFHSSLKKPYRLLIDMSINIRYEGIVESDHPPAAF